MTYIASGTRADWGLLRPLADELRRRGEDVKILVTHAHLMESMGMTVNEIIADGYQPAARIPASGTPAQVMAQALEGFGALFATPEGRPDHLVILGDRYEMLGVASAALFAGVPVAHIAGGTRSDGAFDNTVRDAISIMSQLHFPETEECAQRLIARGIDAADITVAGALGLSHLDGRTGAAPRSQGEFWSDPEADPYLVMTLHAETRPCSEDYSLVEETRKVLEVLEGRLDTLRLIITYPNADVDPAEAIALLESFARRHPGRVMVTPSLGHRRYLEAVEHSCGVVGNSSSGIVEVPSLGVPTLDLGRRQWGRQSAESVIRCPETDTQSIAAALDRLLSPEVQAQARKRANPYYRPATAARIATRLLLPPTL